MRVAPRPGLQGGRNEDARLGFHLMLGTVPAGVVGYLFEDAVERAFGDPRLADWVRITVGTPEQNGRLLAELERLLEDAEP